MMPVFTAPKAESEEAAEATSKQGRMTPRTLIITTLAGVGLLLGLLYAFAFRGDSGTTASPDSLPTAGQGSPTGDKREPLPDLITRDHGAVGPQRLPLPEIQKLALQQVVDLARSRDENRNRAYSRHLAAEAFAITGDVTKAREQLQLLQNVGAQVPFYQVEPLVQILWQELAKGDTAAAKATLATAQSAGQRMPVAGRATLDASVALAAGETALDQLSAAQKRLADDNIEASRARAAALAQMVFDLKTFDLDQLVRNSTLDLLSEPLQASVAVRLISNGQTEQALAWALAEDDVAARDDSLAALSLAAAYELIAGGNQEPLGRVKGVLAQQTPSAQGRMLAGMATGYLLAGDRTAAGSSLQEALAVLEQVKPQPAMSAPTMLKIYQSKGARNSGLPETSAVRSAVLGILQVAQLQHLLGQPDAAWTTLKKAWEFTPSMGPGYRDVAQLNNVVSENPNAAQERLARELGLNTRDEKERAFRDYRRQLNDFVDAAAARFQLEQALLKEAIGWGLLSQVGDFLKNPGQAPHSESQPYLEGSIASTLEQHLAAAPAREKLTALHQSLQGRSIPADTVARLYLGTEKLFREGNYREAGEQLAQIRGEQDQLRDQRAQQLACRLVRDKKLPELIDFVQSLKDAVLGEDCLKMAGALSVSQGLAPDLWNTYDSQGLNATEKIALLRGMIDGIVAHTQRAAATTPPADEEAQASQASLPPQ